MWGFESPGGHHLRWLARPGVPRRRRLEVHDLTRRGLERTLEMVACNRPKPSATPPLILSTSQTLLEFLKGRLPQKGLSLLAARKPRIFRNSEPPPEAVSRGADKLLFSPNHTCYRPVTPPVRLLFPRKAGVFAQLSRILVFLARFLPFRAEKREIYPFFAL